MVNKAGHINTTLDSIKLVNQPRSDQITNALISDQTKDQCQQQNPLTSKIHGALDFRSGSEFDTNLGYNSKLPDSQIS